MPLCHRCEWKNVPPDDERRRKACLACPGPEEQPSHKGASHISIDAGGAQTYAEVEASLQKAHGEDGRAPLDPDDPVVAEAMLAGGRRVLLYLSDLSKEQVVLLWQLLREGSLAGIGRATGRTRARISKMWRDMVGVRPELAGVVPSFGGRKRTPPKEKKPRPTKKIPRPAQGSFMRELFGGAE